MLSKSVHLQGCLVDEDICGGLLSGIVNKPARMSPSWPIRSTKRKGALHTHTSIRVQSGTFCHTSTNAGQYEFEFVYVCTHFSLQKSQPLKVAQKWICIQNIQGVSGSLSKCLSLLLQLESNLSAQTGDIFFLLIGTF